MAESVTEQIVLVVQGLLTSIVGDGGTTYWFTPDRVIRAAGMHKGLFDESLGTVYVIIPDDGDKRRDSNRTLLADIRLDLVLMTRFTAPELPFSPDVPSRQTLQSRLSQDVEKAIIANPALDAFRGLDVSDVRIVSEERSAEATWTEGWAVAILRLAIQYRYRVAQP